VKQESTTSAGGPREAVPHVFGVVPSNTLRGKEISKEKKGKQKKRANDGTTKCACSNSEEKTCQTNGDCKKKKPERNLVPSRTKGGSK